MCLHVSTDQCVLKKVFIEVDKIYCYIPLTISLILKIIISWLISNFYKKLILLSFQQIQDQLVSPRNRVQNLICDSPIKIQHFVSLSEKILQSSSTVLSLKLWLYLYNEDCILLGKIHQCWLAASWHLSMLYHYTTFILHECKV